MRQHLVAFLTDYGMRDGFVAVCHGVIAGIAPDVRVLDVSHEVPPQDVRHGARVLARVAPHLPPAVYVAVVDPGVGTSRRSIALQAGDSMLVGPDNGLLVEVASVLGGIDAAYSLTNKDWWLPSVDKTFHGRDIFAPVAARLARGDSIRDAGIPLPIDEVVRLPEPVAFTSGGVLTTEVTYVDGFGNVQLAGILESPGSVFFVRQKASAANRGACGAIRGGGSPSARVLPEAESSQARKRPEGDVLATARLAKAFGDVADGELLLYQDSDRQLALAVNRGSAAALLGVRTGSLLDLAPSSPTEKPA